MGDNNGAKQFEWVEEGGGDLFSSFGGRAKRKWRPKKKKFIGWGSKQLVQFLESIGKMSREALSQHDVTSIVNQYITENSLTNPLKKKRVLCDEKLYALFGRKSIGRIKIYNLLESHLAQNQDDSEGSDMYSSDEEEENFHVNNKQQKISSLEGKTQSKKKLCEAPRSCFAAVKAENIKLMYLKRSLVQNLLMDPETFEKKLVGSFVRVKSDPLDYLQKNSHQLQLVMGVKKVATASNDSPEMFLEIADMTKDVKISELSDDNFSEEECKDLGQKIKNGILKQLNVVELQQKAQLLHEDITKHWLVREIDRLQKLIDRANEKGWRREMFEYRERRKLLRTPSEQSRLLQEVPQVIAEELIVDVVSANNKHQVEEEADNLPNSIQCPETTCADDLIEEGTHNQTKSIVWMFSHDPPANGVVRTSSSTDLKAQGSEPVRVELETSGHLQPSKLRAETGGHNQLLKMEIESIAPSRVETMSNGQPQPLSHNKAISLQAGPTRSTDHRVVIDLSDDDDDNDDKKQTAPSTSLDDEVWHYMDPQYSIQGPFSMRCLGYWNSLGYFPEEFVVWKTGQSSNEAVLLKKSLSEMLPPR